MFTIIMFQNTLILLVDTKFQHKHASQNIFKATIQLLSIKHDTKREW